MAEKNVGPEQRNPDIDKLLHRRKEPSAGDLAGGGLQFAAAIIVSSMAGSWLDRRFGTGPWLLLLTVFVGAAAGFYSMYRQFTKYDRQGK